MTTPPGGSRGCGVDPVDVLNLDEEGALSKIREIVGEIRASGRPALLEDVERALVSIGGTVSNETEGGGSRIYALGGARFELAADSGSCGTIQLGFTPAR